MKLSKLKKNLYKKTQDLYYYWIKVDGKFNRLVTKDDLIDLRSWFDSDPNLPNHYDVSICNWLDGYVYPTQRNISKSLDYLCTWEGNTGKFSISIVSTKRSQQMILQRDGKRLVEQLKNLDYFDVTSCTLCGEFGYNGTEVIVKKEF